MSMDTYGIIGFTSDNVGIDRRIYTGSSINGETDPILPVSYNGGRVDVYLNGIKLVGDHSEMPSGTRDYTFTQTGQGSSIQLRTGVALVSADVVECIGHVGLGSNVVTSYNPTPANTDGGWNVFASINHTTSDLVNVFLNGVLLDDSDYTLDAGNDKVTIGGATLTASDVVVIQVIGALDNSNFVPAGGGTFTGDVTVPNLKLSSNVIKASDGGSTITLDTSDNVTIAGGLTATGGITNAGTISAGTIGTGVTGFGLITNADQWRITTNHDTGSDVLTSNFEQVDTGPFNTIGSSMSQSSGVFTFPRTGIWLIHVIANFTASVSEARAYNGVHIQTSEDANAGSPTYTQRTQNYCSFNSDQYASMSACLIMDVVSTTTHKVRFKKEVPSSTGSRLIGATTTNYNAFTFIRLGDT